MNNFRFYLINIFCLLFINTAIAQFDFPKYKTAVRHFFECNNLSKYIKPEFSFQKKPGGWFVDITSNDTIHILKSIWNSKTKLFYGEKLIDTSVNEKYNALIAGYIDNWEFIHFDACPYYGYKGWDTDVIRDFGTYDGNDTNALYGIGRAFSTSADNLLSDRSRMSDSLTMFNFKDDSQKLSQDQIATYRTIEDLAITYYKKVEKLDPHYQTIVGDIGFKCANEYMTTCLDLLMYSDHSEAVKELKDSLYDNYLMEFAYNLLMSCEKNAVLIVNGDLDTFVPMYLQEIKGIRQDVTIINCGMLDLPRYVNYLRNKAGVRLTMRNKDIAENKLEYIYIKSNADRLIWTSDELFTFLKKKSNIKSYNGYTYASIPVNQFVTPVGKNILKWSYDSDYLYKYLLLIADIVSTNINKRQIYFSTTVASESYDYFIDNLAKEGLVYHLTGDRYETRNSFTEVDLNKTFENIFTNYKWTHLKEAERHEKLVSINYRIMLEELAALLASKGNSDSAKRVLNFYNENLGNNIIPYNELSYQLVKAYYLLGNIKEGNKVAEIICSNIKNNISIVEPEVIHLASHNDINTKLEKLRELMNQYGQADEYLKYN